MSSEQLADGVNPLDAELAATWDVLKGYSGRDTDLGIARRFGGSAAAYSLRDIGAMNGRVVKVRRNVDGDGTDKEEDFSANQVSSGALEDWVNGKLEVTLPADVNTAAAAYSLRKVSEGRLIYTGDYSSDTNNISANSTNLTVTGNNDDIFTKDNVLKIENDGQSVPQLQTDTGFYRTSKNGIVEFEYYVPSDHPIVGNYWHIGTASSGGQEIAYTKKGAKIVGGAWTTAKLFYGEKFGGSDKPTGVSDGGQRLITILNKEISDGIVSLVNAEDGDIYYISSLTIKLGIDDVVRIRRSSDNVEVEVGFDSDDKISSSSPVSNRIEEGRTELGITTATTLGGFLGETSITTGVAQMAQGDSSLLSNATTTGFTLTQDGNLIGAMFPFSSNISAGTKVTMTFTLSEDSGNATSSFRLFGTSDLLNAGSPSSIAKNDAGTYTIEFEATGEARGIGFFDNVNASVVTISNASITIENSAFVHTWYDQAGVNDAVQATAANQPQIASSGALLTDGIEFDGTNDRLVSSDGVSVTTTTDISFNLVGESDNITTTQTILSQKSGTGQGRSWTDIISSNFRSSIGGSAKTFGSVGSNGTQFLFTYILDESANTVDAFKNAAQSGSQQTVNNAEAADGEIVIGCNNGESGQFLNGHLKEVIIYTSDQTDNRFKIESNINNYYGLYTFQGDGFVETWYDQSGNGNDATQGTAGNQPTIVQNGGLISDGIQFDGSADALNFTDLTLTDASIFTVLDIDGTENLQIILGGSTSTTTATMIPMMQTSSTTTQVYKNATVGGAEQGNSQFRNGSQITLDNRGDAYTELAAQDKMLFTMIDVDVAEAKVLDGISQTPSDATTWALKGTMEELIIYNSDLSSDRGTIESEIANHYNITLS